jgi:hypothetical protein
MSYIGRGSYLAAAVAGVASAFYIFEPEFIALKNQREASGQNTATASAPESSPAAASSSSALNAGGRWQEMKSRDGRLYWMNLETGVARVRVAGLFRFKSFFDSVVIQVIT